MERAQRQQIQSWMVRVAEGDRSAFEPLFRALLPVLEAFAGRFLGGSPEGQDAAQEALVAVFRRAHEFDRERDALSWVLGITAFQCRTLRKRRLRRKELPAEAAQGRAPTALPASQEESLLRREMEAVAEAALADLGPMDRETIRAALGAAPRPAVAAATFRKRLERAWRRLRVAGRVRYDAE